MTKEEFLSILIDYRFKEDTEYKGIYWHPECGSIGTWWVEKDSTMAINWGLEYTIYRKPSYARLIALLELYQNP